MEEQSKREGDSRLEEILDARGNERGDIESQGLGGDDEASYEQRGCGGGVAKDVDRIFQ